MLGCTEWSRAEHALQSFLSKPLYPSQKTKPANSSIATDELKSTIRKPLGQKKQPRFTTKLLCTQFIIMIYFQFMRYRES